MMQLFLLAVSLAVVSASSIANAQVKNGSFEANTVGTTENGNAASIIGWRLYDINAGVTTSARIVSPGTEGNNAVSITVTNSGLAQGQYGFDNFTDKTQVVAGKSYVLSFDLSGEVGGNFAVTLADYRGQTYTGVETHYLRVHITKPGFQTYTFKYTAGSPSVCIGFYVAEQVTGTQTVTLDNVQLVPVDVP